MAAFWKKGLGMGLGAGLLGAVLVALRARGRPRSQPPLPDVISPTVFARRVQRTTRGQMVYHVSGEGNPLVFLHDLAPGAASYEWSKIYPSFAATHRVLAPDWIGFGESERADRPWRAEDYAQSLQEFCRATCGGKRPFIVAAGAGAAVACLAAAQHPELAARLVLFHPAGTEGWLAARVPVPLRAAAWTAGGRRWLYRKFLSAPEGIGRWLEARRSEGPPADLTEAASVYASFARQDGAAWAAGRLLAGRLRLSPLPRLEQTCLPVTIWWPGHRTAPPPAGLAGQPSVRLDWIEEWGPLAPLDRSAEVSERLRQELFHPVRMADVDGD